MLQGRGHERSCLGSLGGNVSNRLELGLTPFSGLSPTLPSVTWMFNLLGVRRFPSMFHVKPLLPTYDNGLSIQAIIVLARQLASEKAGLIASFTN